MNAIIHKHRDVRNISWGVVSAYTVLIIMTYIYTYGDILGDYYTFDIMGNYKCIPKFDGCEDQIFDGWAMLRVLAFTILGYINPHSHTNAVIGVTLIQLYSYSHKKPGRHILNPILSIIGYSIGSALCSGCYPEESSVDKNITKK